jgi:Condensation domain
MPRVALSTIQEGLWAATVMSGAPSLYNVPLAYRLDGPIDAGALEQALTTVVERHEPLRTAVRSDGGGVWGEVQPAGPVAIERAAEPVLSSRDLDVVLGQLVERPFDLENGPLIRAALIPVGPAAAVLGLVVHHLAFDGWSEAVLLGELGEVYSAAVERRPAQLPPRPAPFSDHADRERQRLADPAWQARVRALAARFDPAPAPLEWPWDRPPVAPVAAPRQEVVRRALPEALCAGTKALGRAERATWFMVLLAGVHALLARETGQRDQILGTVTAGRGPGDEGLIGCFVNTVPLRLTVEPGLSFRELLTQVRATTLAAMRDQDVPFPALVLAARPRRDRVRMPIVQSVFVLQNTPVPDPAFAGLQVVRLPGSNAVAKYDVTFEVEPDALGWRTSFEFRADLFDAATATRLLAAYEAVLTAAVTAPDARIS